MLSAECGRCSGRSIILRQENTVIFVLDHHGKPVYREQLCCAFSVVKHVHWCTDTFIRGWLMD